MDKITLTSEMLLRAKTYMPIAGKVAFVENAAAKSRLRIQIAGENSALVPDRFAESTERKNRFLLGALVKYYLGFAFDGAEEEEYLLSWDDYDAYAGSHIVNQIERLKADKAVRDICFDLISDWKALEKMLNAELYVTMQVQNDLLLRIGDTLQRGAMEGSVASVKEQLTQIAGELSAYKQEMEADNASAV